MFKSKMLTLKQYRETALGNMKGEISNDTNKEIGDEILEILSNFSEDFRILYVSTIHEGRKTSEFLDALKKMVSLVKTLKDLPDQKKKDDPDPLSNTVARPHNGPDGAGGGEGG